MAISKAKNVGDDADETLEEYIDRKVEEKVEERVAEETEEIRDELEAERDRRQKTERALAELHRHTNTKKVGEDAFHYAVAMIASQLTGDDVDYTDAPPEQRHHFSQVGEKFQNIENTVARHESVIEEHGQPSADSKSAAWQDTIEAAQNLQGSRNNGLPDNRVKLFTENIEQATGYTNRRAGQLIDEWNDEKEGTEKQPYARVPTSRKTESSGIQKKALIIDLDVWGDE